MIARNKQVQESSCEREGKKKENLAKSTCQIFPIESFISKTLASKNCEQFVAKMLKNFSNSKILKLKR
jgi:hypothetical protein